MKDSNGYLVGLFHNSIKYRFCNTNGFIMPGIRRMTRTAVNTTIDEMALQMEPPLHPATDEVSTVEPSSEISIPTEHEDDSDFEEPPPMKPTRGRKRGSGRKGEGSKRGRKDGGGAAHGRGRRAVEEDLAGGSLFDVVKAGRALLQSVVDEWIETYKNDRDLALLELIQFFINCSGCKGKITPYMYANMEHVEIIRKMTEEFEEETGDYPLIMTGPQWKKFKGNFCEMVQVLVRQCQYSIIYDQYMMDNLISLLTGLTDSQVRAFRHTSTLAAMKLMTALVDVALNLSINLDNTQRQYEAERQKTQNKRANERLDILLAKRQELEENQAEIRSMLTYIFKGVFVHRYRDTQPEIRAICMTEIGVWMKKYPNMFLDDRYLKYVGWTLYDKTGDVRLGCLKALQPLYDMQDLAEKLELFTNRFKDRIVEMTLDKETEVAVQGVKLVISILRFNEAVLPDKDCENVYELVYSSHRQVAQAAGEFLNAKLFRKDEEAAHNLKTAKGKKRSPNTPLIRDLVQFFIESELHEHGSYLVDSLWDINDMMKDWECMTDLLLEEPGKGEEALDDRQEASLIELMVCCVRQAATGESPVGRATGRKHTAREQKQALEDKTRLTEHFIQALPQLLLKYLMDSDKQEKHLETLLRYLHEIAEKLIDSEVLRHCSQCYEVLCNEEYGIAGKCNVARKTLIDSQVVRFREAMQDFFAEEEQPDEDESYALLAALKRINAFYSCHDMSSWDLWEDLFHILRAANDNQGIPEPIVCKAMVACSSSLLWYLQKLDDNDPNKDAMRYLRKRLDELMRHCHNLMYHQQDQITEESFVTICDLLIVFGKHLGDNAVMRPLIYEPDKNLQTQLTNFLTDKVFVEDDDDDVDENVKIEELHKRRNFLASFCKLVVFNVVSIRVAADMFKHYMKFYNDYGDIIKATLSKSREINKVATAKTLALSLTQLYHELQAEQGVIDRSSDAFQSIKELARRFALSFGLDQVKNREAVAAMHKEGIIFSLNCTGNLYNPNSPPPNLSFLEVLCEFTNKLMKQDKKVVVAYLDKQLGKVSQQTTDDWQPLWTYRNSLTQGEHEIHPITLKQATQRRYGKRKAVVDDESNASDHWSNEAPTPAPNMMPQQTSTAVKRRRVEDISNEEMHSEPGSEQDFQDSGGVGMSQVSWLNAQNRQHELQCHAEANYSRMRQGHGIPPPQMESEPTSEGASISEFESPQMIRQPQQHHHQMAPPVHPHHPHSHTPGLYENSSQSIEDPSSELSHPGF
ncbi:hypothetical protein ScPMuIL_018995 [Solemya velum]